MKRNISHTTTLLSWLGSRKKVNQSSIARREDLCNEIFRQPASGRERKIWKCCHEIVISYFTPLSFPAYERAVARLINKNVLNFLCCLFLSYFREVKRNELLSTFCLLLNFQLPGFKFLRENSLSLEVPGDIWLFWGLYVYDVICD